jgi:hypothetical protein
MPAISLFGTRSGSEPSGQFDGLEGDGGDRLFGKGLRECGIGG